MNFVPNCFRLAFLFSIIAFLPACLAIGDDDEKADCPEPAAIIETKKAAEPEPTPQAPLSTLSEEAFVEGSRRGFNAAPAEGEPADGDWLVRHFSQDPTTLNPITATDVYEGRVNEYVYESLLERNPRTLEYEPMLAESWEAAPDNMSFTFKIRRGVRWHDGKPFTADDVVYSFKTLMDPKTDAAPQRVYYSLIGSFEKTGADTVRCVMARPYFNALGLCAGLPIVAKHVFSGGADFNKHPAGRAPVGTGPMRFVRWKTGKEIVLERNPDYWRKRRPRFSRFVFRIISNEMVALQLFRRGELDMIGLTPEWWFKQAATGKFLKKFPRLKFDYPSFNYIGWNQRREPFGDRLVRRAMTMLLDRETILRKIFHGLGRVAYSPVFFKIPLFNKRLSPLPYDPDGAKALLAAAGWKDTDGDGVLDKEGKKFEFELSLPSGGQDYESIATLYKESLEKVGIVLRIRKIEWAALIAKINDRNIDACMLGWALGVDVDPYQLWHSSQADLKGSSNFVGFKNSEADRLIEAARVTADPLIRKALLDRFQEIIHFEQPYTFLFVRKALMALSPRITNVSFFAPRPCYDVGEWFVPPARRKYAAP